MGLVDVFRQSIFPIIAQFDGLDRARNYYPAVPTKKPIEFEKDETNWFPYDAYRFE